MIIPHSLNTNRKWYGVEKLDRICETCYIFWNVETKCQGGGKGPSRLLFFRAEMELEFIPSLWYWSLILVSNNPYILPLWFYLQPRWKNQRMEQRQALLTLWRGGQGCLEREEEKNRIWRDRDEDYLGLAERRDWGEEGINIYNHLIFIINYLIGGSRGREGLVCTCSARERIRRSIGNLDWDFLSLFLCPW